MMIGSLSARGTFPLYACAYGSADDQNGPNKLCCPQNHRLSSGSSVTDSVTRNKMTATRMWRVGSLA